MISNDFPAPGDAQTPHPEIAHTHPEIAHCHPEIAHPHPEITHSLPEITQIAAVLLMLLLTGTFGWLVVIGSAHSRTLFAPDDRRSVWGWPFRRKPADPD